MFLIFGNILLMNFRINFYNRHLKKITFIKTLSFLHYLYVDFIRASF